MNKVYYIIMGLSIILSGCASENAEPLSAVSPGGDLAVSFYLDQNGRPGYLAKYKGKTILDSSALGFMLSEDRALQNNFRLINSRPSSHDETWEQPWGEQRLIRDHHNELIVELENQDGLKMNVVFRAFDDGFAFRYEFPEQDGLTDFEIMDELTEFNLPGNHEAWWIPAYAGNRYEYIYQKDPVNDLDLMHTPMTLETSDSLYLVIHEAELRDYSSMVLKADGENGLKCDLVPWSTTNPVKCYVSAPSKTPWRTIQVAERPADLITSYMILNLNEPNKLGDVSWVEPGKYVGIWWEMHINTGTWHQGPKHAATTKNTKKYIDFASRHGFDGVLVEGWNYGWDGDWMNGGTKFDFTRPYPDYDVDELSRYARERDVYLVGHHETGADIENYESQLETAYQFLEDHGMKAVKTGYVENGDTLPNGNYHHGQYYVRHFYKAIETAANHRVAILAHEPIKDTGERRTYPNMISREGARGQEYNAWSADGGNPPSHVTVLPFTRMVSGPMDYTPGVFDIQLPTQPDNQINHTLAKELALYVVIYAPMQMACDLPENYEGHPAFQFIKDVGVDWETTKAINGEIGEFVAIARKERGTDKWFLGAITNEDPRSMKINLDFLDKGKTYNATLYIDGEDAHYLDNPTAYKIEEKEVTSETTLDLELAASGGAAISFIPVQ